MRQTLPKEARLRHSADFDRAYRHRRSVSDQLLILYARPNDLPNTRLGLSVSRNVGNAVHRNRWKRRLREAFRLMRHELPGGLDLIAIPRSPEPPQLDVLKSSLLRLARRVNKRARETRTSPPPRPHTP
ncbi:MAG: ribonuclease P protein component [Planctomycetia bacterium]|nr:ribonuclease P protein component [Planctomycetia bacterium]